MKRFTALATLPLAATYSALATEESVDVSQALTEINPDSNVEGNSKEAHTNGLIADLAWILLLGAIVTVLFKKLKQPVVLGYILAGFLASPKFIYLPSIASLDNIEFWADLGIVVLMFTLGLEFSFKKLMNSGSSAIVTALIIITGMTFAGFGVGRLLNLDTINCIFLGGMVSMSSTTIILKTLNDLGMRQRKFATLVLAVLIIEDLFAVLMLVLLSSLAEGHVEGGDLLFSLGKLVFFLIIWFIVGVYILPSLLNKIKGSLNDETLLVVSMGLCFSMAILSVICGFSLELGAFVVGSVLGGTMFAERMEKVVQPVKDLFGAVFFISVGMMVDPAVLGTYWAEILLLAVVVIVGMITFGTLGMLVTGQSLRVALESGFTLTQIGEFSFIIASLGMSLGVLRPSLYPIIVAVSVITIFTTPYFVKLSQPASVWCENHLPKSLRFLINRYSGQTSEDKGSKTLWRAILSRYIWRILLYSVLLIAVILVSKQFIYPFFDRFPNWGKLIATSISLICMLPFLIALCFSSTRPDEKSQLHSYDAHYEVPLVVMRVIRYIVALFFVVYFMSLNYDTTIGWITGLTCFVIILLFASRSVAKAYHKMEDRFLNNLNIRENTRLGINNNIVSDLHQAYIEVSPYCPFAGDRLMDSGLRRDYGISVSSIQRGEHILPLPSKESRVFPGDVLGIIGTDDQIKQLNDDIDNYEKGIRKLQQPEPEVQLSSFRLTDKSPLVGKRLADNDIRKEFYAMIVKVQRGEDDYHQPSPDFVPQPGDVLWVVGDPNQFIKMK